MKNTTSEQIWNPTAVALILDSRVVDVMAEIAGAMEFSGRAQIDWNEYRTVAFGKEKKSAANIRNILFRLEEAGFITRDPGSMTWNILWVNPIAVRPIGFKEAFFVNAVRGFCIKREKARIARLGENTNIEMDKMNMLLMIGDREDLKKMGAPCLMLPPVL